MTHETTLSHTRKSQCCNSENLADNTHFHLHMYHMMYVTDFIYTATHPRISPFTHTYPLPQPMTGDIRSTQTLNEQKQSKKPNPPKYQQRTCSHLVAETATTAVDHDADLSLLLNAHLTRRELVIYLVHDLDLSIMIACSQGTQLKHSRTSLSLQQTRLYMTMPY